MELLLSGSGVVRVVRYVVMIVLPVITLYGIFLVSVWWTHRKGAERDEQ